MGKGMEGGRCSGIVNVAPIEGVDLEVIPINAVVADAGDIIGGAAFGGEESYDLGLLDVLVISPCYIWRIMS